MDFSDLWIALNASTASDPVILEYPLMVILASFHVNVIFCMYLFNALRNDNVDS